MALPNSPNTITAAMINKELGRAENAPFNLNDSAVRALAGKPSGAISFSDFWGKSSKISVSFNTPANYFSGNLNGVDGSDLISGSTVVEYITIYAEMGNVTVVDIGITSFDIPLPSTSAGSVSFTYGSTTLTCSGVLHSSSGKLSQFYGNTNDLVLVQELYRNRSSPMVITIKQS